jgi:hypothetical protein
MKRALLLLTVVLLALAAPWRVALRSAAAASNPGQVTMTLTYAKTGTMKQNAGGMGTSSGSIAINMSETCVYNVLEWTDRSISLDDGNCNTAVTAEGSVQSSVETFDCGAITARSRASGCKPVTKTSSWTCSAVQPKGKMTRLDLDPVTGTGTISMDTPQVISKSDTGDTATGNCDVYAGSPFNGGAQESVVAEANKYIADLSAAEHFKFNPNDSSFSGGNSFRTSPSSGGVDARIGLTASGSTSFTYSVHGGAPKDQTEVEIVPPKLYEQWLPQAGDDEKTIGNYIEAQIVAHKKDDPDSPPPKQVLKYTVTLQKTSREKGVNLNWPLKGKDDYDLKLDATNALLKITGDADQAQSAETTQEDIEAFIVRVNCYDWGGYTNLAVTAELSDHTTVTAHVRGSGQQSLAIPKDDDGNHIADSWEESFGLHGGDPASDEDSQPAGHEHNGDSIALYDEYRGFRIQGKPQRLSPVTKDLFIWDASSLGAGIYQASTGVTPRLINETERTYGGSSQNMFIVTPNGHYGDVHPIWLRSGAIGETGVVGETKGGGWVPSEIYSVTIDSNEIVVQYKALEPELQVTIGHELGHTTNVNHHGDQEKDYLVGDVVCHRGIGPCPQGDMACVQKQGTVKNYICAESKPGTGCYQVAAKGGSFSGNDTCPMRYDKTCFYEDPKGICTAKHNGATVTLSFFGTDPPGVGKLCTSNKGTGVNDTSKPPNKAGDADLGNCASQVCLKNGAH